MRGEIKNAAGAQTRRDFLKTTVAAATIVTCQAILVASAEDEPSVGSGQVTKDPWHRRTYRWGQTNITELVRPRFRYQAALTIFNSASRMVNG